MTDNDFEALAGAILDDKANVADQYRFEQELRHRTGAPNALEEGHKVDRPELSKKAQQAAARLGLQVPQ